MKTASFALGLACAAALSTSVEAKTVTLTTTLANYGGDGAYLAIYVTDAQGKVVSTLHVAGPKAKYYKHLRDWSRGNAGKRVDGVTGASVGSGRTLKVSVQVADALIDAGHQIRIDSSVENLRDNPSEVVVPLTAASTGTAVTGKGYVKSFRVDM